ncbi:MAG: dockerin type I domain-containing protein [Desulfococcaceae bacterium]|nr:dockerin type I domain-containing protein [Desulfococcaceae bacterium]
MPPEQCTEDGTGSLDFPTSKVTPGNAVTIPLRIQNAPGNVEATGFDIIIPDGLTYTGFEKGSLVPAGYILDVNVISANTLRCGAYKVSGTDVIAAGASGDIVKITFDVAATFASPQKINLSALKDDIAAWSATPGCVIEGCDGDTNGDGQITPADALNAFEKYMLVCPTSAGLDCDSFCADVNRDGNVTPADALCIFRKYLGQPGCLD